MANSYRTSTGEKVFKSEVDKRILEAKRKKVESMMDEHNYIFCEICNRNSSAGEPIDCSTILELKMHKKVAEQNLLGMQKILR